MNEFPDNLSNRRRFLGTLGAAVAAGMVGSAAGESALAQDVSFDAWLDALKGKHKQLFDWPEPEGGAGLRHVKSFLNTWRDAYGVHEKDVSVIVALYARTLPLGLSDEMWEKYQLGQTLGITDPKTNAPLVRNWFAHPQDGDPVADGQLDAAMEKLQGRGVLFIVCNQAIGNWSAKLAPAHGGDPAAIRADLLAHVVHGAVVVPGVLVAMNKAHERGFGYVRF